LRAFEEYFIFYLSPPSTHIFLDQKWQKSNPLVPEPMNLVLTQEYGSLNKQVCKFEGDLPYHCCHNEDITEEEYCNLEELVREVSIKRRDFH
jgi:hypothetical protein